MQIALYVAQHGNRLDTAIDLLSGSRGFSHAELVFSDGCSFSSTSRGTDGCVDASGRPKPNGTRWKRIDYAANANRWVLIDLPDIDETVVRAFCNTELDALYDWWGVMRFTAPFIKQHPDDWFCSEVVVAALQTAGLLLDLKPHKTSPNTLGRYFNVRPPA